MTVEVLAERSTERWRKRERKAPTGKVGNDNPQDPLQGR